MPSTESVNVFDVPHAAVVDMPTVWLPLTVAPSAGYVIDAVKPAVGFETLTLRVAVAVALAASVTVSVRV